MSGSELYARRRAILVDVVLIMAAVALAVLADVENRWLNRRWRTARMNKGEARTL